MAKSGEKGFTLTELMVVLVLLAVLLTVSGFGLAAYSRYSAQKQAQEYARMLYLAAQSSLTHAKASGQLEALREETEELVQSGCFLREADGTVLFLNHTDAEGEEMFLRLVEDALTDGSVLEGDIRIRADLEQALVRQVEYRMEDSIVGVYQ